MTRIPLFLAIPLIIWLIRESKEWEEGEWLKMQGRKLATTSSTAAKHTWRFFTSPTMWEREDGSESDFK